MDTKFNENIPFEKRCEYSAAIARNFPNMVPIVISVGKSDGTIKLTKSKFLAPHELTFAKFAANVRTHSTIRETQSIFMLVNNMIPGMQTTIGEIYKRHKNKDGFLYITVSTENCFGDMYAVECTIS
jgi:hypothetical protein